MQIRSSFRCFLFSALLAALHPTLPAQELLEINTHERCIFSGGALDEELYRFPDNGDLNTIIQDIVEMMGEKPIQFSWHQCNVESVAAVLDADKRYLLYSFDYLQKQGGDVLFAVLAHEIAHHQLEHTFAPENFTREELEADSAMGICMSRLMLGTAESFEKVLDRLVFSPGLPRDARLAAARSGFKSDTTDYRNKTSAGSLPFDDEAENTKDDTALPTFPWPPPACNTRSELPKTVFKNCKTLGDTERKLRWALENKGYTQHSYFSVPNGFAMVTQLEQYNGTDGAVRNDHTRWLEYPVKQTFAGVLDYLTALVVPHKGYFRLFVFVVTDQPFGGGEKRVSKEQATAWLNQGFNKLPNSLATKGYNANYDVTTLVYEFEVPESNRKPVQKCPSPRFNAKTHLRKSGLAKSLGF